MNELEKQMVKSKKRDELFLLTIVTTDDGVDPSGGSG